MGLPLGPVLGSCVSVMPGVSFSACFSVIVGGRGSACGTGGVVLSVNVRVGIRDCVNLKAQR